MSSSRATDIMNIDNGVEHTIDTTLSITWSRLFRNQYYLNIDERGFIIFYPSRHHDHGALIQYGINCILH